jgi:hypothetical protein
MLDIYIRSKLFFPSKQFNLKVQYETPCTLVYPSSVIQEETETNCISTSFPGSVLYAPTSWGKRGNEIDYISTHESFVRSDLLALEIQYKLPQKTNIIYTG